MHATRQPNRIHYLSCLIIPAGDRISQAQTVKSEYASAVRFLRPLGCLHTHVAESHQKKNLWRAKVKINSTTRHPITKEFSFIRSECGLTLHTREMTGLIGNSFSSKLGGIYKKKKKKPKPSCENNYESLLVLEKQHCFFVAMWCLPLHLPNLPSHYWSRPWKVKFLLSRRRLKTIVLCVCQQDSRTKFTQKAIQVKQQLYKKHHSYLIINHLESFSSS